MGLWWGSVTLPRKEPTCCALGGCEGSARERSTVAGRKNPVLGPVAASKQRKVSDRMRECGHDSSPGREPRVPRAPAQWSGPAIAYLLTWTTYGTWLPGDSRGSVGEQGKPGHPIDSPDVQRVELARERMVCPAFILSNEQRAIVQAVVREHTAFRGWTLHAVNTRTNHVHVVLSANAKPEDAMGKLKSRVSRVLHETGVSPNRSASGRSTEARGTSTRPSH